jgi:hypothetical protein
MKHLATLAFLIAVLIFSYFSVKYLTIPGFFPIHDDTQIVRVHEMTKSLSDGMFPVRWVEDLGYGYGYPIFNFYAPLPYYIGSFFNLSGFDALSSTKIMMLLGVLLAGVFMFILGKKLWGNLGGLVSSIFYIYVPYHALDIYVRGDVSEFWAYAFIPLVFYFLIELYKSNNFRFAALGGISFAMLILSHNLTAYMITPFLLLFILIFSFKNIKFLIYSSILILIGLGISSFYTLPVAFEIGYTNVLSQVGGGADYKDHFVCLPQLWESQWGFGGSAPGCIDGMSFRIGKLHILDFIFTSICLLFGLFSKNNIRKIQEYKTQFKFLMFSLVGFLSSLFLMIEFSKIIWDTVPFMKFLQFPWRFLIFSSFFTSIFAGFIIWAIERISEKKFNKLPLIVSFAAIVSLIFLNYRLFIPQTIINKASDEYIDKKFINWEVSKISDEYMPKEFSKPKEIIEIPSSKLYGDNIEVLSEESSVKEINARIRAEKETKLNINIAFFPTWKGFVNNVEVELKEDSKGMIAMVPRGESTFRLLFEETTVQRLGNYTSLAFIILAIAGIIYPIRKNEKSKS